MAKALEAKIISILGGEKVVGKKVRNVLDLDSLIREGFPYSSVTHIKEVTDLNDDNFAEILGISKKTLGRVKKSRGKFSKVASDRLFRFAKILAFAADVFKSEERAVKWLNEPQFGLNWKIPLDLIDTEAGSSEVEDLIGRIEHGVYS